MGSSDPLASDILESVQHPLPPGITAAELDDLFGKLESQAADDLSALQGAPSEADLAGLRVKWLGRKQGIIRSIADNWLAQAPGHLKPEIGKKLNALRQRAEQQIEALSLAPAPTAAAKDALDITLPGRRRAIGAEHPLRIVTGEITEIFISLGYSVEEGPEIESTYYNFEALNIPEDHPARDDQDTFYIDSKTVLRTHTSPVQVRTMERRQPPLRIIVPGKAYRHDAPDATHSPVFHQVEGLAVDTHIRFSDLKGTLDYLMKAFFGPAVRTRLRPSFFPFTEPSAEVDISCLFCGGTAGCRICKQTGWIELGGCGMVDPAVYAYVKYDPERFSGFAFGIGLERLAMLKYGVPDIQLFYQSDIRFLHQFR